MSIWGGINLEGGYKTKRVDEDWGSVMKRGLKGEIKKKWHKKRWNRIQRGRGIKDDTFGIMRRIATRCRFIQNRIRFI